MRVLLDECVDERLRHSFAEHHCETASYAGLAGLKNGALLSAAEAAGFEVMVTVDQNIPHQQNFHSRRLAVLILKAPTSRLRHLQQTIPKALQALKTIQPGEVLTLP